MFTYYGTVGEEIVNPTEQFLEEIFFDKNEDYWKCGGGDSCIEVEGCSERIIFFYDEPFGFFIMRHPDYLVMCDDSIEIKTIEHKVGGEPMKVPTCSYVSRKRAYDIITSYIKNKKMPEDISWCELYEIDFDYDF